MAKESKEAGFGQSSAGEGEPPDTHAEKHLREFLHDLGRLSRPLARLSVSALML